MGSAASSTNTNAGNTRRRLEGKVAIVTGGASGVGASTARLFNDHGAQVIIADIQEDLGRSLAHELGENVSFLHCDVSNEDQVSALVDASVAEHGMLDIMFNNAGVDADVPSILDDDEEEDGVLERVLGVNVRGAFYGAKHAARVMGSARRGCILFRSGGGNGSHLDAMSKYGIIGLTKNLSAEVGKQGIRVNCISHQQNSHQEDQISIARAALYLASDDANYVSGHNLRFIVQMA